MIRDGELQRYFFIVPSVTHVWGTVTGTKLLLEPNLYSGNINGSNYSFKVLCLNVTGTVKKFLFRSNFPIPGNDPG